MVDYLTKENAPVMSLPQIVAGHTPRQARVVAGSIRWFGRKTDFRPQQRTGAYGTGRAGQITPPDQHQQQRVTK